MAYRPATPEELAAMIVEAAALGRSVAISGTGSKPGIGPGTADAALDVTGLGGTITHDPGELLLTLPASTPLLHVEQLLARAGQCLAFEPPSPDAIWGLGHGTIGGAAASGLSGPRRPFAGGCRDHVLGLSGVTGRGEIFTAGGKVLKNVTGFDLPRLLTGSRGTLAVLTEITLKVLPLAPAQATLLLPADTAARAVRIMADACQIDGGITGAAWSDAAVHLRIETSVAALPALMDAARARLPAGTVMHDAGSRTLWAGIASLAGHVQADDIVWRCPLPATRAPALAALLPPAARLRLDWAGALAWVLLPADLADLDLHALVAQAAGRDGHAERLRGPASIVPARARLEPGLAALSARVKAQFDPAGILSPAAAP
ncbi:FAD-binding protein [Sandarakinorhabdus sp.]|uniref:FAD-binding protein n=1 Tax=Sandarakinorhabdus sp. TaxID=1916663 RepID=UPI00356353CB